MLEDLVGGEIFVFLLVLFLFNDGVDEMWMEVDSEEVKFLLLLQSGEVYEILYEMFVVVEIDGGDEGDEGDEDDVMVDILFEDNV